MRFLIAVVAVAVSLLSSGCVYGKSKKGPVVHPTDEQIDKSSPGAAVEDAPYVPWWAEAAR